MTPYIVYFLIGALACGMYRSYKADMSEPASNVWAITLLVAWPVGLLWVAAMVLWLLPKFVWWLVTGKGIE